jgi:smad nuclear-interacting protein 1
MPRRSPSPNSFERYRNSDDRGKYRSRRDDPRRGADRESQRGAYRDRRGFSERDTRRGYPDNNSNDNDGNSRQRRRGDGDDDRHRRKNGTGYDSLEEEGRRRRDEGSTGTDRRYASRHDEGDDKRNDHSRRGEYGDRGGADRDRPEDRDDRDRRERERDRGDDERRGSPRRRSASPRRSRPHSRSRSPSAAASPPEDKTKPNFAPSGLLAAATNTVRKADGTSTLLKYNEPPEARKPLVGWRLYVFKGDEQVGAQFSFLFFHLLRLILTHIRSQRRVCGRVDLLHIHRQSAYLIGRDPTVTDIPLEHPSCSKQHAVIQCNLCFMCSTVFVFIRFFTDRLVQQKDEFGSSKGVIKQVPFFL